MQKQIRRLAGSNRAQGMVEYILIVALIALVALAGIKIFGSKLAGMFQSKAEQIETEVGSDD